MPTSLEIQRDWSDHALWWEQKQQWLLRTAWTLDKCGVHADARLIFTPQHKPLRLGLPSGITLKVRACFSNPMFRSIMGICKILSKLILLCSYSSKNACVLYSTYPPCSVIILLEVMLLFPKLIFLLYHPLVMFIAFRYSAPRGALLASPC